MEKHTLKVAKRSVIGRKVHTLRKAGKTPGNVFGKHIKSFAVEVDTKEFLSMFAKVGETGIIELALDAVAHPVLVHNVSYHPVTSKTIHVDFLEVNLKEKVTTKVPVVLVGEALAVKEKLGVILTLLNELEVEALPMDLPEKIEVDITSLAKIGDSTKVSDLKISDKVKILTLTTSDVVKVAPLVSKEAEKMAAEEAAAAASAPTTAEGAAAAGAEASSKQAGAPAASTPSAASSKKEESPKK